MVLVESTTREMSEVASLRLWLTSPRLEVEYETQTCPKAKDAQYSGTVVTCWLLGPESESEAMLALRALLQSERALCINVPLRISYAVPGERCSSWHLRMHTSPARCIACSRRARLGMQLPVPPPRTSTPVFAWPQWRAVDPSHAPRTHSILGKQQGQSIAKLHAAWNGRSTVESQSRIGDAQEGRGGGFARRRWAGNRDSGLGIGGACDAAYFDGCCRVST